MSIYNPNNKGISLNDNYFWITVVYTSFCQMVKYTPCHCELTFYKPNDTMRCSVPLSMEQTMVCRTGHTVLSKTYYPKISNIKISFTQFQQYSFHSQTYGYLCIYFLNGIFLYLLALNISYIIQRLHQTPSLDNIKITYTKHRFTTLHIWIPLTKSQNYSFHGQTDEFMISIFLEGFYHAQISTLDTRLHPKAPPNTISRQQENHTKIR